MKLLRHRLTLLVMLAVSLSSVSLLFAQPDFEPDQLAIVPPGFATSIVADGLQFPLDMEFMPSGDILVAEKGQGVDIDGVSVIKLVRNGVIAETPVLELSTNVFWDSGLHGFVLAPDFATTGHLYIWYSTGQNSLDWDGESSARLSRFRYDFDTETIPSASELIMIDTNVWRRWHHGNSQIFDANGFMYVGVGELGNFFNAGNLSHWEGKILRIRPTDFGYTIPADNPFVGVDGAKTEIVASGFRNPYRMALRQSDGLIAIAEVGADDWEEINVLSFGANYGWPEREGPCPVGEQLPCPPAPSYLTDPAVAYTHNEDGRGSITGLTFYEGQSFPEEYHDALFFGDLPNNFIGIADLQTGEIENFADINGGLVDLVYYKQNLYYVDINSGQINIIYFTDSDNQIPTVTLDADVTAGPPELTVNFSAEAFDPDDTVLTYRWKMGDGTMINTTESTITHTYSTDGTYVASVQVVDIRGGESALAMETITVYSGEFPQINLENLTDPERAVYYAGDLYQFSAERSTFDDLDPETPFSWRLDFHHNTHFHPIISSQNAVSSTIRLPIDNHDGAFDLWYEFILTMHTLDGQDVVINAELLPQLVDVAVRTTPGEGKLLVNGVREKAPFTLTSIVGIENQFVALPDMLVGQDLYKPLQWRYEATTIMTDTVGFQAPAVNTTYTADYVYDRPAFRIFQPILFGASAEPFGVLAPHD